MFRPEWWTSFLDLQYLTMWLIGFMFVAMFASGAAYCARKVWKYGKRFFRTRWSVTRIVYPYDDTVKYQIVVKKFGLVIGRSQEMDSYDEAVTAAEKDSQKIKRFTVWNG